MNGPQSHKMLLVTITRDFINIIVFYYV